MEIHEKYQIPIIKRGRVGIPLTGLTLSHFCTCPKKDAINEFGIKY
jgi:hypothetical protein